MYFFLRRFFPSHLCSLFLREWTRCQSSCFRFLPLDQIFMDSLSPARAVGNCPHSRLKQARREEDGLKSRTKTSLSQKSLFARGVCHQEEIKLLLEVLGRGNRISVSKHPKQHGFPTTMHSHVGGPSKFSILFPPFQLDPRRPLLDDSAINFDCREHRKKELFLP